MPAVKFLEPEYAVIVGAYPVHHPDYSPKGNAGRSPRMLRQHGLLPTMTLYFNYNDNALLARFTTTSEKFVT